MYDALRESRYFLRTRIPTLNGPRDTLCMEMVAGYGQDSLVILRRVRDSGAGDAVGWGAARSCLQFFFLHAGTGGIGDSLPIDSLPTSVSFGIRGSIISLSYHLQPISKWLTIRQAKCEGRFLQ